MLAALGRTRELLGDLDAAETTFRRALALLDEPRGQGEIDHVRAAALAGLAHVCLLQGRYDDADALSARRLPVAPS